MNEELDGYNAAGLPVTDIQHRRCNALRDCESIGALQAMGVEFSGRGACANRHACDYAALIAPSVPGMGQNLLPERR